MMMIIIIDYKLYRLRWFGHVQRMGENGVPKRALCMNLGTTRLRGRPWNRWQDGVREDGWIVGGEGWQEKVRNREEWKKLLRTARNCCILHVPMEWMNGYNNNNNLENDCLLKWIGHYVKNKTISFCFSDEGKYFPVHTLQLYRGHRGIAPLILNLITRWRWVLSCMPQPLYLWEEPQYALEAGLA